jgi:membrane carboxypeptidase/penicillin-binding protein
MRTLKLLPAAFALVIMGLPLFAQSSHPSRSAADAQLRINVVVVRAIMPGRHDNDRRDDKDKDRDRQAVSYNFRPHNDNLFVTEEIRPMLVVVQGSSAQKQSVQLTTVVAK